MLLKMANQTYLINAPVEEQISIHDVFEEIIDLIENHPATMEFCVCFISVIFGAVVTCWLSNREMRNQCRFNLIYERLKEERILAETLWKDLEKLEIKISHIVAHSGSREKAFDITPLYSDVQDIGRKLFQLNEQMMDMPPVLYKYIKPGMVESSAAYVSKYNEIFIDKSDGFWNLKYKTEIFMEQVNQLRELVSKLRKSRDEFIEVEDRLISHGFLAWLKRKFLPFRKIVRDVRGSLSQHK